MAIPEYPITRREQYLDAIATNDTSVLPAEPITRTEQYLDTIARNGGGGGGGGSTGGGVLAVHIDEEYSTLDKTWQEIHDALAQGTPCVTLYAEDDDVMQGIIASAVIGGPPDSRVYTVHAITTQGDAVVGETWKATSTDDYPVAGS